MTVGQSVSMRGADHVAYYLFGTRHYNHIANVAMHHSSLDPMTRKYWEGSPIFHCQMDTRCHKILVQTSMTSEEE